MLGPFPNGEFGFGDGAGNFQVQVVPQGWAVNFLRIHTSPSVSNRINRAKTLCQRADVAASLCSSAINTFSRIIFVARQRDSKVPASVHPPSMRL